MRIDFQWSRRPDGRWASVPTVPLGAYRLARRDAQLAVFKPTPAALAQGFAISLVLCIGMAGIHFGAAPFVFGPAERAIERDARASALQADADALRRSMIESGIASAEEIDAAQAAAQRRVDAANARRIASEARIAQVVRPLYYGALSVLGAFAFLAPASFLWRNVRLSRSIRGETAVSWTSYLGWPKSASWAKGDLTGLRVGCLVEQERTRRGAYRTLGWRWRLTAFGADGAPRVTLTLSRQAARPVEGMAVPGDVESACRVVESVWGIPCDRTAPFIEGEPDAFGRSGGVRISQPVMMNREKVQTYSSIDDIPPHLQAQARAMLEEAQRTGKPVSSSVTTTTQRFDMAGGAITFRDVDGVERTYRSADEMPPEVRARYEDLMRRFRGG